jgi:hypothetical protein
MPRRKHIDIVPPDVALLIAPIDPGFLAWVEEQPIATKRKIAAHWPETEADPRLVPGHRNATHARLVFLIEHCAERYGYARR